MYFARVAANVYKQTEKTKEERDKMAVSVVSNAMSQQVYIIHTGCLLHHLSCCRKFLHEANKHAEKYLGL